MSARTGRCAQCDAPVRWRSLCRLCYSRLPRTKAYSRWRDMLRRCYNPKERSYRWYGARGITVCQRWRVSFADYYADTGDCPAPGLTLDRINNDGPYEPANMRWATVAQQQANRRPYTAGNAAKRECLNGHSFDEENTYWLRGRRWCRACGRDRAAKRRSRRRAA